MIFRLPVLSCFTALALLVSSNVARAEESDWSRTPQTTTDLQRIQQRLQKLLPKAKEATVAVLGEGSGSGVIISRDGLILTAGHVCGKAGTELDIILSNGAMVKATSLGAIKLSDAGLVRLAPGRYPFAKIAPAREAIPLGMWCFALGHPGGWDSRRGAVVRLGRVISQSSRTLRSDCKLVGGDSGGPLFDLQGRVIAVHSRISKGADQNFHVPLTTYRVHWPEHLTGRVVVLPSESRQSSTAAPDRTTP